jgi:hypothetical protein
MLALKSFPILPLLPRQMARHSNMTHPDGMAVLGEPIIAVYLAQTWEPQ